MTRTITVAWLDEKNACEDQVAIVRAEWGGGEIPLTRANLRRAVALKLDIDWLAERVLAYETWRACYATLTEAWRVYGAAVTEAWRVYDAALTEPERIYHVPAVKAQHIYVATVTEAQHIYVATVTEAVVDALGEPK